MSISRHFIPPLGEDLLLASAGLLLTTSYSFPKTLVCSKTFKFNHVFFLLFQMKTNVRSDQQQATVLVGTSSWRRFALT